jgi:transcriptional regulator with XRE-family HTH domain
MPIPNTRLKRERQLRGWSQAHVAEQLGVADYYISRWERGEVVPSPFYQERLCTLFGKTAEELGILQKQESSPSNKVPGDELTSHLTAQPATETFPSPHVGQSPAPQTPPPLQLPLTPPPPVYEPTGKLPRIAPKKQHPPVRMILVLLALTLAVLGSASLGILVFFPRTSPTVTILAVGHLYFLSSGQTSTTSNQGIADEVQFDLHSLAAPAAGTSYYAWLLPDSDQPENPAILLGKIAVSNGVGTLFYRDPEYTNLLAVTSRLLVTQEDATVRPLTPSTDPRTWRYQAQIPQIRPQAAPGEASYSVLDHLRHLLSNDPTLEKYALPGGLLMWFSRNIGRVAEWSSGALGEWQPGGSFETQLLRRYLTRILDYLDGTTYVRLEMPPPTTILVPRREGGIGLLQMIPHQQPPDYITHIELHLHGLTSAPGDTPFQQKHAGQILAALNTINQWLEQVRQDAKRLFVMTDPQLRSNDALILLNDLQLTATAASSGQTNQLTGTVQPGAEQIRQQVQGLATLEITL